VGRKTEAGFTGVDGEGIGGRSGVIHPLWRGRGIHSRWISRPFLFSFHGVEADNERKHQGGKGSAATSPALVSPFGIPLPRRPLCKEWPKGETHPHYGEQGKLILAYVVPGGVAQALRGLPFGSQPLQFFISPWPPARAAAACPLWPSGLLGHVLGATTE